MFLKRLRSCEAASELLAKYKSEEENMAAYMEEVRSRPIEDLGPSEGEREAERLRVRNAARF